MRPVSDLKSLAVNGQAVGAVSRLRGLLAAACVGLVYAGSVSAEPTTKPVHILYVRPYNNAGQGAVFVQVDAVSLCNTDTYMIDLGLGGAKEAYAAALTALLTNRPVAIEVANSGCTGWGTAVQSLYLY